MWNNGENIFQKFILATTAMAHLHQITTNLFKDTFAAQQQQQQKKTQFPKTIELVILQKSTSNNNKITKHVLLTQQNVCGARLCGPCHVAIMLNATAPQLQQQRHIINSNQASQPASYPSNSPWAALSSQLWLWQMQVFCSVFSLLQHIKQQFDDFDLILTTAATTTTKNNIIKCRRVHV